MTTKLKNITRTLTNLGIATAIIVGVVMVTSEPPPKESPHRGGPFYSIRYAPIFLQHPLSKESMQTGRINSAEIIHQINTNIRWKSMNNFERYAWMEEVYQQELRDMKAAKAKGEHYISRARRNLGYASSVNYFLPDYYDIDLYDVNYDNSPMLPLPKERPNASLAELRRARMIPYEFNRLEDLSDEEIKKIGEAAAARVKEKMEALKAQYATKQGK